MIKIKLICIFLVFMLSVNLCQGQGYEYKTIDNKYASFKQLPSSFTNIVNYLPQNYVKDASVDYTKYIQKALDTNKKIVFPNFPLLINDNGLRLRNGSEVYFNKNSKLILKPSGKESY